MMLLNIAFEVILAEGNFQSFPFNGYKNFLLQFFAQVSITMSADPSTLFRTCFIIGIRGM